MIIEDDPYWYLQFPSAAGLEATSRGLPIPPTEPAHTFAKSTGYTFLDSLVPSYLNIDTDGRVVRLDTFSKTVAPGCRLGWITAQPAIVERILRITESSTQQPSGFVQAMIAELILGPQAKSQSASFLRKSKAEQASFAGWKVDGWVRWLEGLRGSYERRMNRMCALLEAGRFQLKQGTPLKVAESDWAVISKTAMYSFDWPRGGMFIWVKMHYETHPLYGQVEDTRLANAMWLFFITKPYLLLVSPGLIFSPTDEVRDQEGWKFFRLCFAAVEEEEVDRCSESFAKAVKAFWAIKDKKELEGIEDSIDVQKAQEEGGLVDLGMGMAC
jgi:DNA-binding transcriptional MocR family regulator